MAVLVPLFSKNLDFSTPIFKSTILVPLFCQILKLHLSLFSFDDVADFSIMWHFLKVISEQSLNQLKARSFICHNVNSFRKRHNNIIYKFKKET
jgi:hypothetical protein